MPASPYLHESDDGDDVWGDSSDDGEAQDRRELAREAQSREKSFHTAGYREGIEDGKARTLQQGFNLGFQEGARAGFSMGRMSASVKTLELFAGQVRGTSQLQEPVAGLSRKIQAVTPHQAMLAAFRRVLSRAPGAADLEPHLRRPAPGAAAEQEAGPSGAAAHQAPASPSSHGGRLLEASSSQEAAPPAQDPRRDAPGRGPGGGGGGGEGEGPDGDGDDDENEGADPALPSADELAEAVARLFVADSKADPAEGLGLPDVAALMQEVQRELLALGYDVGPFDLLASTAQCRRRGLAEE